MRPRIRPEYHSHVAMHGSPLLSFGTSGQRIPLLLSLVPLDLEKNCQMTDRHKEADLQGTFDGIVEQIFDGKLLIFIRNLISLDNLIFMEPKIHKLLTKRRK